MQFIESSIVGVRSAVLTLGRRASPMRFVLFPMVHVAERSFYDEVASRVRNCAFVVAEGVPAGALPLQETMARLRLDHLVDQSVSLDLGSLGIPVLWEYDVRPPRSRSERLLHRAADSYGAIAARVRGRYGDLRGLPSIDEYDFHDVRWELREQDSGRRDGALTRRLTSLHHEHHQRPIRVAVVYGAAHMPAVVEHLRGEFGYYVKDAEWLVVVNAPS